MKLILRRYIRKFIRNSGFQRRLAPDFMDVMNELDINLVLDVGANDGGYGREIRDRGYKGIIISFEPNPNAFKRLIKNIKNDKKWIAFQYAIGESNGILNLHITENDVMSSFKEVTKFGDTKDTIIKEQIDTVVCTLDSFLNINNYWDYNIYLKIDTQGYEMEVLGGSENSLNKICAVQAEISLIHTYIGQPDWVDVILWMRKRNFELSTAICNSVVGAQVREFDFVFTKHKLNNEKN
jgi:FkbM family methyltransferase